MFSILKGATRLAVLGGFAVAAVVGTSVAVAGRDRTAAMAHHMQDRIVSVIDRNIDDPTALRAQLRKLEQEYPKRIAALAGDLGQLREQMRQLERERAISERVVQLAETDLGRLEDQVASAVTARQTGLASNGRASLDEHDPSLAQAKTRLEQVRQTRFVYAGRAADATRDLSYLDQQAVRLEDALTQVESERAQFQAQLWQIERQVDTIARNDRLIAMMNQRKQTLEEAGRFEAVSLDHVAGRLAEVRTRQEAELQVLSNDQQRLGYEEQARFDVDTGERAADAYGAHADARADAAALDVLAHPNTRLTPRR